MKKKYYFFNEETKTFTPPKPENKLNNSSGYYDKNLVPVWAKTFKNTFNKHIKQPQQAKTIFKPVETKPLTDNEGLSYAYKNEDGIFTYGDTMYIAGTKDWAWLKDPLDDLLIPIGQTAHTHRYVDAEKHLNNNIKNVVGHSLGGAAALELQKNYPHLRTVTYGAPVVSSPFEGQNERYRNYTDPVSILDRGANMEYNNLNSHSFTNFDRTTASPKIEYIVGNNENKYYDKIENLNNKK
jgi:hypothetical protein